jgi:hypothetical protein
MADKSMHSLPSFGPRKRKSCLQYVFFSFFLSAPQSSEKDEILKVVEEVCFVLVSLADSIT